MTFYGDDKKVHADDVVRPSFLVDGEWIKVERFVKFEKQNENMVKIEFLLEGGATGSMLISNLKDLGFKINVVCNDVKVKAIRGVTSLAPVEEIYGFGEMWNGRVAQRGQSFDLWDQSGTPDECAYMPYYVSTNNYVFSLNYGGNVNFDVGQSNSNELVFQADTAVFDITLITGNSLAEAVQNFQKVAGLPSAPPRWAFKPWFWLMGDPNKPGADINTLKGEHFPQMIRKLKAMDIPVGVTWLEPPWQDARTSFIPDKEFSPDLKGLIKEIDDLGVKTLAWTVPYTTNSSANWKEAVGKGYLVRKPSGKKSDENFKVTETGELEGNFYTAIDFFNPEAATWWQKQIEKSLDLGLKGYKLDAGQDLPGDALLYGGRVGRDVHNSYALEYNKVYYNAFKNKLGDDFLMIPRAAWIGSASYTNFKWPGDLAGDFANNGLPSTVYSSISLVLSGIPFVSTDIGGFQDRPAPENVWIRWAQFGTFLPGMQTLHMPWWYSEKAIAHFRYLAWLHTDLIPFWMSLACEAKSSGTPVIRPLVWDYQNDVKCWRVDDQFTVGNAILVAPIMNTNVDRDVYLPEGVWYDFWDEKQAIRGPKKINWNKGWGDAFYKFPLYIREGAIIPMEISNNVTGFGSAASQGFVTLAVWPKTKGASEFTLKDTEDAVPIKVDRPTDNQINVSWGKTSKNFILRVHISNGKLPESILSRGDSIMSANYNSLDSFRADSDTGWYFDNVTGNLWVRIMNNGKDGSVKIGLK
jgi:alpha-D-xyloside xylohydrolase